MNVNFTLHSVKWSILSPPGPAQRRPGSRPRRHDVGAQVLDQDRGALNEGRGRDPGDTYLDTTDDRYDRCAQRRPGSRPRRHTRRWCSTPARVSAQRRPGSRPRRHMDGSRPYEEKCPRSTKAGVETPATPVGGDPRDVLRVHRSTKAGVETPATHGPLLSRGELVERSRKAGVETPATRRADDVDCPACLRSTKAGVETPATQLAHAGHAHAVSRSTKAGVETPATRPGPP